MIKIDKEVDIKRAIDEKNKFASEWKNIIRIKDVEESSSSSSMSMYSLDCDREDSEVPSHRSPTLIQDQFLENQQEVHSYQTTEKIPSERYLIIHEEENPSTYNIEEIIEPFTFNLYKKEVNQKRVWNEKQNDENMKEVQEDQV